MCKTSTNAECTGANIKQRNSNVQTMDFNCRSRMRHPVVTLITLVSLMSWCSCFCFPDVCIPPRHRAKTELANRLNKLLESQKTCSEQVTELATLLNEITTDTCLAVTVAMTKLVALCKEHTRLQEAFLDGMTHNLDNGRLTMSSTAAVIDGFKNHGGNLNTVALVQRAFDRLQQAYSYADELARKDQGLSAVSAKDHAMPRHLVVRSQHAGASNSFLLQ